MHEPSGCHGCSAGLSGAREVGSVRRQVFDIPPVSVRVTEHQLVCRECACGLRTRAAAPAGVDAAVQYGPRIAAIVVYLYVGQFLSKKRTAQALAELFGTPLSGGTVAAMTGRGADGLTGFLELVADRIAAAPVAHFDETGLRVDGRLRWVHSASTGRYSLITCHDKRGTLAMDAAGVLPGFAGVAVHDAWAPYDTYAGISHALCNAHVLRELQAVADTTDTTEAFDTQTGTGTGSCRCWCWATQAADALREIKDLVDTALGADITLAGIDPVKLAEQVHRYRSAAVLGATQNADRESKLTAKHHALARRLTNREADYLRFPVDPLVPFDNNAAEREIRMIKLRQNVTGCLRTLTGAKQVCAIRSYLATAAKHRMHFYDALTQLAEGHPWTPITAMTC